MAWSVQQGAHLEYTSHYIISGFDLIAKEDTEFSPSRLGIDFGKNTSEIVVIDSQIEGFATGIDLEKTWINLDLTDADHNFTVIDTTMIDVGQEYRSYDPAYDFVGTRADLAYDSPNLDINGPLVYEQFANGWFVYIDGMKQDTLGEVDYPGGSDQFYMTGKDVQKMLATDGYYTTSDGQAYFLIDLYLTDRISGEIYAETHPVYMSDDAAARLGSEWYEFHSAIDNGEQDIVEIDGVLWAGDTPLDVALPVEPTTASAESGGMTTLAYDPMGSLVLAGEDLAASGTPEDAEVSAPPADAEDGRTVALMKAAASFDFDDDMTETSDDEAEVDEDTAPAKPPEAPGLDTAPGLIQLPGLSAAHGHALSMMDAEDLAEMFAAANLGGDVTVLIDEIADTVSLAVNGHVPDDAPSAADEGSDAVWVALTQGQGLADDLLLPMDPSEDEEDPLVAA